MADVEALRGRFAALRGEVDGIQQAAGEMLLTLSALDPVTEAIQQGPEAALMRVNTALLDIQAQAEPSFEALSEAATGALPAVSAIADEVSALRGDLDWLVRHPTINVSVKASGLPFGGFGAEGGPVSRGTLYVVGEEGPELFVPDSNGRIIPNDALPSGGTSTRGGGSLTVNFNISGVLDNAGAQRAIDALDRAYERRTGRRLVELAG